MCSPTVKTFQPQSRNKKKLRFTLFISIAVLSWVLFFYGLTNKQFSAIWLGVQNGWAPTNQASRWNGGGRDDMCRHRMRIVLICFVLFCFIFLIILLTINQNGNVRYTELCSHDHTCEVPSYHRWQSKTSIVMHIDSVKSEMRSRVNNDFCITVYVLHITNTRAFSRLIIQSK